VKLSRRKELEGRGEGWKEYKSKRKEEGKDIINKE
jgi:hypothetical protein